ncbi:N-acetyltransferase family protein [Leptospira sp. WS39.C2]
MLIREGKPSDIPQIYQLILKKADFDRSLGDFNGTVTTDETKIKDTMFNPNPFAFVFLAIHESGQTIGMALYHIRYSSFKGLPSIWLDDLYLLEGYRGLGIGEKLFTKLTNLALQIKATHLGWVASDLNSIGKSFYTKLGAKIVGQIGSTLHYEFIMDQSIRPK